MWTLRISTMDNAKRQRLFKRLAMMQSPDIEVPAQADDARNASTIENNNIVGQTNPRGDGLGAHSRGLAINPSATSVA